MNSNTKIVALVIVGASLIAILAFLFKDDLAPALQCNDGMRNPINIHNFTTKYGAYSVELEANIGEKGRGKLSGKLDPTQLQAISDALQQANELRKFVVAGFNRCAITKVQYAEFGSRFQQLDSLSRQIDRLAAVPNPTDSDKVRLTRLIDEYVVFIQQLAKSANK
jgi:hypothetical protein